MRGRDLVVPFLIFFFVGGVLKFNRRAVYVGKAFFFIKAGKIFPMHCYFLKSTRKVNSKINSYLTVKLFSFLIEQVEMQCKIIENGSIYIC